MKRLFMAVIAAAAVLSACNSARAQGGPPAGVQVYPVPRYYGYYSPSQPYFRPYYTYRFRDYDPYMYDGDYYYGRYGYFPDDGRYRYRYRYYGPQRTASRYYEPRVYVR